MDLQLALLMIGVFIVAAVGLGAYDRARIRSRLSQAKSPGPRAETAAAAPEPGPRIDTNPGLHRARDSKVLSSDAPAPPPAQQSPQQEFYQQLQEIEHAAVMPVPRGVSAGGPGRGVVQAAPDDKVDFVINLPGAGPVVRDQALSIYKQNEYLTDKPHAIYGLRLGTGIWTSLERDAPEAEYSNIALAVQMVDSRGPISESELNTFAQLGLKLADSLHRPTKLSCTFEEAMTQAQALARFCDTYDVIAGVNILPISRDGFPGRAVRSAAQRFGLELGAHSIFHRNNHAAGCRHLFSLANLFEPGTFDPARLDSMPVQGLALFMRVPCVHQPVKVFDRMTETGRNLCAALGGKLVDQERRPLSPRGVGVIRAQIESIAASMQNLGIAPGSATALRLFEPA